MIAEVRADRANANEEVKTIGLSGLLERILGGLQEKLVLELIWKLICKLTSELTSELMLGLILELRM